MNLSKCTKLCFKIRNGKREQKESAAPSSWSSSSWALDSMWLATLISSDHILIRSWKQKRQNEIILGIFISLVLNTASWWKCNLSLTIKRLKGLTQLQTYHIPNIFCLFYNVYRAKMFYCRTLLLRNLLFSIPQTMYYQISQQSLKTIKIRNIFSEIPSLLQIQS